MSHIITLVASETPLSDSTINIVGDYTDLTWLASEKAVDIHMAHKPNEAAINYIRSALADQKIDVFLTKAENRRKKLLLADMDSTTVTGETLDDLAAYAGIKDQIAAITARAMNGELNFHAAIRERVGLLKDLSASTITNTLKEIEITKGFQTFIKTMKTNGAICVLVSGGFTVFTQPIAKQLGFDHHHGNTLIIENDKLTGEVGDPIQDKDSKLAFLNQYAADHNLTLDDALTIGDGANDLPMLLAAGLGLGYNPKPAVAQQLTNVIRFNDATAALYAQGFKQEEFSQ